MDSQEANKIPFATIHLTSELRIVFIGHCLWHHVEIDEEKGFLVNAFNN